MRMKLFSVAVLMAAACLPAGARAAAADNTAKGYTPTTGPVYSVPSTVILQGNPDGSYGAVPINSSHPLPITCTSGCSSSGGGGTVQIDQTTPGTTNGVVVNSSALPTGAATAAKQPALGTAGTPSADVITVQGSASGTAMPVSAAALPLPTGAATSAAQTSAQTSLSAIATSVANIPASPATAGNQTTAQTSLSAIATSDASIDTKTPSKGAATTANSTPVNIASDQTVTVNDPGLPDTLGQKTSANSTGVVIASDQAAFPITATAASSGGTSYVRAVALTNTAVAVDASAGQFYGYYYYNPNATVCSLQVYSVPSGSVTVGTTTPALTYDIPANGGANVGFPVPINLGGTGISIAATTTATGGTACSSGMDVNVYYK